LPEQKARHNPYQMRRLPPDDHTDRGSTGAELGCQSDGRTWKPMTASLDMPRWGGFTFDTLVATAASLTDGRHGGITRSGPQGNGRGPICGGASLSTWTRPPAGDPRPEPAIGRPTSSRPVGGRPTGILVSTTDASGSGCRRRTDGGAGSYCVERAAAGAAALFLWPPQLRCRRGGVARAATCDQHAPSGSSAAVPPEWPSNGTPISLKVPVPVVVDLGRDRARRRRGLRHGPYGRRLLHRVPVDTCRRSGPGRPQATVAVWSYLGSAIPPCRGRAPSLGRRCRRDPRSRSRPRSTRKHQ